MTEQTKISWPEIRHKIYSSFISEDRQKFRSALKKWAKAGCVMSFPKETNFPWVGEEDFFKDYMVRK